MDEKMAILAYILITMTSGLEKEVLEKVSSFDEVVEANFEKWFKRHISASVRSKYFGGNKS